MIKLTRAPNLITAHHWVNVLAMAGIPCELHNRYLSGAMGEIPADQCAPEIWLTDDRDEKIAISVLERVRNPDMNAQQWICRGCHETLEGQFTVCWQCGRARE